MAEKWTPGPWVVDDEGGPESHYNRAPLGVWSEPKFEAALKDIDDKKAAMDEAWICGIWGKISAVERADAHLIAAAPELYEALAQMEYILGGETDAVKKRFADARTAARAALAKARGETP